jgi:cytochrome oxidase Cu insertion factor (SCO1/SenC/PrrC family)
MLVSRIPAVLIALTLVAWVAEPVRAEGDGEMIPVGEPFVDFDLPAHDGTVVRSADLEGRPFLLFFYPKADTPG